ncbi:MAG: sugar transferase [Planctomycetes bacterium]|nr:sugar transferase [Planctomycetota bacterium]
MTRIGEAAKRTLDIAGALLGIPVLALFFPFVAIAIKIDSPGPILFHQRRAGRRGRHFTCHKFRSMVRDAEAMKRELRDRNELAGPWFKIRDDPRVTRVGRFLRRYSIDELPQLINVLRGDMSLVGPRPATLDEVAEYAPWHHARFGFRPGMTGLWQTSGRNEIRDFDEAVRLDIEYMRSWSLRGDLRILARTILGIPLRRGAS